MVRLEDPEYEESVTSGASCFAVPVEAAVDEGADDADVLTYRIAKDAADEYHSRFSSCPFSGEARDFLHARLAPLMEGLGYRPVFEPFKLRKEFAWNREKAPEGVILEDCRIIDSLKGLEFESELPVEEYELFSTIPTDRMAVVSRDGKVVCFAGVNDMSEDGAFEINVECAPGYRRRGFAASCAAKLAGYLTELGEQAVYVCSDRNTASERTALRAGFSPVRTVMSYVCMKTGNGEGPEVEHGI